MKMNLSRLWIILVTSLMTFFLAGSSPPAPQEAKINQKRIERERVKKQKEARKQYEQALKRHKKMQSKQTKTMMKQTGKSAPKNTPVNR